MGRRDGLRHPIRTAYWIGVMAAHWLRILFTGKRRYYLFAMTTDVTLEDSFRAATNHEFLWASEAYLRRLEHQLPDFVLPSSKFLHRGDRCLLQMEGERCVGLIWAAASPIVHLVDGFHYNLADDAFYSYMGYTTPGWRGSGFQPLRKLRLLEALHESGKRVLFGYVDDMSLAALRGTVRSGDRRAGELHLRHGSGKLSFTVDVEVSDWSLRRRA